MARVKGSKNHAVKDAEAKASSHREAITNTQPDNESEILKQLLPAQVAMEQT